MIAPVPVPGRSSRRSLLARRVAVVLLVGALTTAAVLARRSGVDGPMLQRELLALGCLAPPLFLLVFAVGELLHLPGIVFVLEAMGKGSGATKYNIYASASNFPIWWLGLLLGVVAQRYGMRRMLLTEAALGVVGVAVFAVARRQVRRSKLPEELEPAQT